jgi:hypothetical protein
VKRGSPRRIVWTLALAGLALVVTAGPAKGEERFSSPDRGEALLPGSVIETAWVLECRAVAPEADEAELVLSVDGGRTFPIRVSSELSVCASRFRWQVPALPARRARLALRTGSAGGERTETLRVVSAEFTILPDPEGRREELHARGSEWWTRPALSLETADDLLSRSISSHGGVLALERDSWDIVGPDAPTSAAPPNRTRIERVGERSHRSLVGRLSPAPPRIPLALRL